MTVRLSLACLCAAMLLLSGCNAWQHRAEFAPPESRWSESQPSPIAADAPPPAIRTVSCYRTLANVDCFAEKQPSRYYGYTGSYPTD